MAAETEIMLEVLAEADGTRGLSEELTNPHFNIVEWAARSQNRDLMVAARPSDAEMKVPKVLSIGHARSL